MRCTERAQIRRDGEDTPAANELCVICRKPVSVAAHAAMGLKLSTKPNRAAVQTLTTRTGDPCATSDGNKGRILNCLVYLLRVYVMGKLTEIFLSEEPV